jgi:hypothetical protein
MGRQANPSRRAGQKVEIVRLNEPSPERVLKAQLMLLCWSPGEISAAVEDFRREREAEKKEGDLK